MYLRKLFDYSTPLVSAATILAVGAILVACIGAYTAYQVKLSGDRIEVTGSAKEAVVADTARLIINLETRTGITDQDAGYSRIESGSDKIASYLATEGFTDYEMPSLTSYPNFSYPQYGEPTMIGFTVSRQVIVRSKDIDAVSALANDIKPLTGTGYNVTIQMLELTYSKLDELRVRLLSEAIKDAKARAEAIASEAGRTVSTLRNASGGVVQVLPQGGVEVSDYGTYDTQSKNKEVMVTVRASFEL